MARKERLGTLSSREGMMAYVDPVHAHAREPMRP
jgi:hypothetical protein